MTRTETAWAGTDLDIRNPILDSLVQIDLKPKTDKRFINLSLGDPTTNPQLQPPQVAIDAVVAAVQSGLHNGYGPVDGLPSTKAAVADFYSEKSENGLVYAPADVFMMNGASEALDTVITVLCAPRSNILFPRPGFAYCLTTSARRVEDRYYNLIPEQEWAVDLEHMETLVDDKTTAIVLTNPSNPCGSNYTTEHLTDILDFAARHRLPVISDEIYGDIVFKGEQFTALAALNHARSQAYTPGSSPPEKSPVPLLTVGGLAKRWLVPGWRIGWILLHDPLKLFGFNIAQVLKDACTTSLAPSSITQAAVPTILRDTPKSFYDNALEVIEGNALLCAEALGKIDGLKVVRPRGSLYMLVGVEPEAFVGIKDEWDFVQKLVWEEAVFPIPGKCFSYEGYMRIVTASKREDLVEACVRLEDFCRRHRK